MKTYNVQRNVGQAKYLVNYHDGEKTHKDGSPFFDVKIANSNRALTNITDRLKQEGYKRT